MSFLAMESFIEGVPMDRGRRVAVVGGVALFSLAGAAVIIWQARVRQVPLAYIVGVLMVVLGIGFTVVDRTVSDEYLRQNFGGEENAARVRRSFRGGWVGVLLGVAMIALRYFGGGGP